MLQSGGLRFTNLFSSTGTNGGQTASPNARSGLTRTPEQPVPTLVASISGHGFGHASRTLTLLNALVDLDPHLRVVVRTSVAPWLFHRTARPGIVLEPATCDTGAIQRDSLRLDVDETIRAATRFMDTWAERVADEAAALRRLHADAVLADIPALAVAAAGAVGCPSVLLGNFTWDWIYGAYPGGAALAERLGRIYARADLALRLPLAGGFATCPVVENLPLIARVSTRPPQETRARLGWPQDTRLALASFGGFGLEGFDLEALARLDACRVVMPDLARAAGAPHVPALPPGLIPLDETAMQQQGLRYEDIVRAVDVVVSKPGYGIISECAANDTALVYTSRGDFAEYPVLVAGMPALLSTAFIAHDDLFAGRWQDAIEAALGRPRVPRPRTDGAEVGARRLEAWLRDAAATR